MSIPTIITNICSFLASQNIGLSTTSNDGRINSSVNETEILNIIKNNYPFPSGVSIQIPQSRSWCDFEINDNGQFYPVNIKVTTTKTADNLSCKLGIYYALTGKRPAFANEISWNSFFQKLKNDLNQNTTTDYYFLIFNKENINEVFANSLKGLQSLQANGNNLPFQCKWVDNKIFSSRSAIDAQNFILNCFAASIKLRAEIYLNFKNHFPNYV